MASRRHLNPNTISRRGFLGAAGGLVAGGALAGAGTERTAGAVASTSAEAISFYGAHQQGIATSPQRQSVFAAFDVRASARTELVALLKAWTQLAANLCAGRPAGTLDEDIAQVEPDSGASLGLGPARLTVNFGFGPSLFGIGAPDRFGLGSRRPMALVDLPSFPGDALEAASTGGDLTVHACADDPQVAFNAVRQLERVARDTAVIRWAQAGFNETGASEGTSRDLLGFKDGTVNPRGDDELEEFVWVGENQDQPWMVGGTYLVVRRIRLLLDRWDGETLGSQQRVIGRQKRSGAPLSGGDENDPVDLEARGPDGEPAIPLDAHIRLASPQENWEQMLLRRSYAYDAGARPLPGGDEPVLDAGLFFCAYQQNPRLSFIPIYARLAAHDALRRFTLHTASAIAALPAGVSGPSHWIGEDLLE